MRMYRLALFFAIVGALSGMTNYIMIDAGGDNWFDQSVPDMQVINISESDVESLQFDDDTGIFETVTNIPKYVNLLWEVLKGVFLIVEMLDDYLVYDVGGVNLFAPVLYFFQAIIWFIYIFGSIQFILGRATKVME